MKMKYVCKVESGLTPLLLSRSLFWRKKESEGHSLLPFISISQPLRHRQKENFHKACTTQYPSFPSLPIVTFVLPKRKGNFTLIACSLQYKCEDVRKKFLSPFYNFLVSFYSHTYVTCAQCSCIHDAYTIHSTQYKKYILYPKVTSFTLTKRNQ